MNYVKFLNFQILDWLSHSPTDIESYIRPGCIILTIYLRQAESAWEEVSFVFKELLICIYVCLCVCFSMVLTLQVLICFLQLCYDLSSSLNRLLDVSDDSFWRTGWVYIRVQHQIAFIYNGLSNLIKQCNYINVEIATFLVWTIQHSYQIIYAAGQVVIDTSLPLGGNNSSKILSVKPIAISASERAQFLVKGINLTRPTTRYPSSFL